MDEAFSYGLANDIGGFNVKVENGKWYENPEQLLLDYVTVEYWEPFNYANVWVNQAGDVHPPLYYALLHTICSFFKEKFSFWYAGSINVAFAIGTLYILRKILTLMGMKKELIDTLSVGFIFCPGILNAVSFLRMYVMAMFWCILITYFFLQDILKGEDTNKKFYLKIFCVSVLSALTHYYCIVFLALISLLYVVYSISKRSWKSLVTFGITLCGAGGITYLIFPAMIKHIFGSYHTESSISNLENVSDMLDRIEAFGTYINKQIFGGMLLVFCACYVILLLAERKDKNKITGQWLICFIFIPQICYFFLVAKIAMVTDRYLFPIYPLAWLGFCSFIELLSRKIRIKQRIAVLALLGMTVAAYAQAELEYLYRDSKEMLDKAVEYENEDCVCIYGSRSMLHTVLLEIKEYGSVLFVPEDDLQMLPDLVRPQRKDMIVMYVGEREPMSYMIEIQRIIPELTQIKYIGSSSKYGSTYYLSN